METDNQYDWLGGDLIICIYISNISKHSVLSMYIVKSEKPKPNFLQMEEILFFIPFPSVVL